MSGYDHTQKGVLHWLVAGVGLVCVFAAIAGTASLEHGWLLIPPVAIFFGLAPCFAHLRVRDVGDALEITFGPLRVFRKTLRYDQIRSADIGRSTLIDGWGIHRTPGRGWIWNVHGFRCVEVGLWNGSTFRIGTDEPEALETYLRTRVVPA